MNNTKSNILAKIKAYVRSVNPNAKVYLFGSRARNTEHNDSDWDILVLIPSKVDLTYEQKFRHKLFELELEFGVALSTFVYSEKEWNTKYRPTPFYRNIQKEGLKI